MRLQSTYHMQNAKTSRGDTLIVVFLRGAADGLNLIVPHGDPAYYRARPTLAIPRPDDTSALEGNRSANLDGFFGLHPTLAPLLPAWESGHLAIIHACGAPDDSRSHFKAMELMERGVEDETGAATGWLGRHLALHDTGNTSPLRAIGVSARVPRSLYGPTPALAVRDVSDFRLSDDIDDARQFTSVLKSLYAGDSAVSQVGRETLEVLATLENLDLGDGNADTYPDSDFGRGLQQVAHLIKADVGLEVAAIDLEGWDTHFAQAPLFNRLAGDLGQGLAAFYTEMHGALNQLTVVVMTEFGRRVAENASLGTDHGYGSVMLALGGHVAGGKVYGTWPGLAPERRFGPGDLAATTDYRDVLAELSVKRLRTPSVEAVFPEYTPAYPGIFSGNE